MKKALLFLSLSAGLAAPALADLQLAQSKNCMACHAVDKKVIGPSFKDVAAKYKDTGIAAEQSGKANVSAKDGVNAGMSTDVAAGVTKENKDRASAATKGGMEIYEFTQSGVSLQATVAGTKYWKDGKLNQ